MFLSFFMSGFDCVYAYCMVCDCVPVQSCHNSTRWCIRGVLTVREELHRCRDAFLIDYTAGMHWKSAMYDA